jgi:TatD DNase family protein
VLHWFTGSAAELRRAIDLGCFFSVNHAMLSGDKRRALVEAIPRDRILTETDGPFTQTGSRPSVPGDVSETVEILASLAGTDSPTMARQIKSNLRALVG